MTRFFLFICFTPFLKYLYLFSYQPLKLCVACRDGKIHFFANSLNGWVDLAWAYTSKDSKVYHYHEFDSMKLQIYCRLPIRGSWIAYFQNFDMLYVDIIHMTGNILNTFQVIKILVIIGVCYLWLISFTYQFGIIPKDLRDS